MLLYSRYQLKQRIEEKNPNNGLNLIFFFFLARLITQAIKKSFTGDVYYLRLQQIGGLPYRPILFIIKALLEPEFYFITLYIFLKPLTDNRMGTNRN